MGLALRLRGGGDIVCRETWLRNVLCPFFLVFCRLDGFPHSSYFNDGVKQLKGHFLGLGPLETTRRSRC